jgi:Protein of unknown function (DUF2505)
VRFSINQSVAVTPAMAVAAYANPVFYGDRPPSGDISLVEVVSHEDSGSTALIEIRYRFTGSVSSAVKAVIDPTKISWVTRTEIDKDRCRTTFTVLPDHYPDRLDCSGSFVFASGDAGPDSTLITIEGDLKVHVFLVSRSAEQLIVKGLRAYLEAEVATLPEFTAPG